MRRSEAGQLPNLRFIMGAGWPQRSNQFTGPGGMNLNLDPRPGDLPVGGNVLSLRFAPTGLFGRCGHRPHQADQGAVADW